MTGASNLSTTMTTTGIMFRTTGDCMKKHEDIYISQTQLQDRIALGAGDGCELGAKYVLDQLNFCLSGSDLSGAETIRKFIANDFRPHVLLEITDAIGQAKTMLVTERN